MKVDVNGLATPAEVTFYYTPKVAEVAVQYLDQDTDAELVETKVEKIPAGETLTLSAQAIEGYTAAETEQTVSVDPEGNAAPSEVTFFYVPDAAITVQYLDQNTSAVLADPTVEAVAAGETITVPAKTIEGYSATPHEHSVTVDE